MTFGRILVPICNVRLLDLKLDRALDVAARFNSRIDVVFVHRFTDPTTVDGDSILDDKVLEMAEQNWDRETPASDAVTSLVEQWAKRRGIDHHGASPTCHVSMLSEHDPSALARQTRTADLILIGQPGAGMTGQEKDLNKSLLMMSGRPVLVVPSDATAARSSFDHVVLAWDGGLQVSRTVGLVMPLLQACARVSVFSQIEPGASSPPDGREILDYLGCNGITAKFACETYASSRVASALLHYIDEEKATLVCMGAYSNARSLEILIGGNTQHMYHHCKVAIVLSA